VPRGTDLKNDFDGRATVARTGSIRDPPSTKTVDNGAPASPVHAHCRPTSDPFLDTVPILFVQKNCLRALSCAAEALGSWQMRLDAHPSWLSAWQAIQGGLSNVQELLRTRG